MAENTDLYQLLGVLPSDSLEDIQRRLQEIRKQAKAMAGVQDKQEQIAELRKLFEAAVPHFKSQEARAAYDLMRESRGKPQPSSTPKSPPPPREGKVEEVEDLYERLGIDSSASLEDVQKRLQEIRKQAKAMQTVKDKKEQAKILQETFEAASPQFKTLETRAAYDSKLRAYQDAKVEGQLMADADFYAMIKLTPVATPEMIAKRLADLETREEWAEKVGSIREMLLDPTKKADYDKQLAAKKAYDRKKVTLTPVPMRFGSTEVARWEDLEAAIDANKPLGLARLMDGEIAGWAEWSLGRRPLAFRVQQFTRDANDSDTPAMELERFLRMFNPSRPFVLYETGQAPGSANAPVINHPKDLLVIAKTHQKLLAQRFDYFVLWLGDADPDLLDQLDAVGAEGSAEVQIERLLFLLDPQLEAPNYVLEGIEDDAIDFGPVGKIGSPTRQFTIRHQGRGYLYGRVVAREEWLTLDVDTFEGAATTVMVGIDRSKLTAGDSYTGKIGIRAVDGRAPNSVITASIYMQTLKDMAGNIGESAKNLGKNVSQKLSSLFGRKRDE